MAVISFSICCLVTTVSGAQRTVELFRYFFNLQTWAENVEVTTKAKTFFSDVRISTSGIVLRVWLRLIKER